jgi:hypothetical protein
MQKLDILILVSIICIVLYLMYLYNKEEKLIDTVRDNSNKSIIDYIFGSVLPFARF